MKIQSVDIHCEILQGAPHDPTYIGCSLWSGIHLDWIRPLQRATKIRRNNPTIVSVPSILGLPFGVMEVGGGLAIIYPETRVIAGRFLALFLVGVYPANLYMWTHDVAFNGTQFDTTGHILRLVAQLLLIVAALYLSGDLLSKSPA